MESKKVAMNTYLKLLRVGARVQDQKANIDGESNGSRDTTESDAAQSNAVHLKQRALGEAKYGGVQPGEELS